MVHPKKNREHNGYWVSCAVARAHTLSDDVCIHRGIGLLQFKPNRFKDVKQTDRMDSFVVVFWLFHYNINHFWVITEWKRRSVHIEYGTRRYYSQLPHWLWAKGSHYIWWAQPKSNFSAPNYPTFFNLHLNDMRHER